MTTLPTTRRALAAAHDAALAEADRLYAATRRYVTRER